MINFYPMNFLFQFSQQGQARISDLEQGYHLYHSLSLRLSKTIFDNVLLNHGGLPHVLTLSVYLDLGHLPDTQVGCWWWSIRL